jgi:peptide deformylase
MYREIVKWPSASLNQKSIPAIIDSEECQQVIEDLKDTFRVKDGFGLAAPQIGSNVRIITVNPSAIEMDAAHQIGEQLIMINPEIECSGECVLSKEACFSLPGIAAAVKRYPECMVTFAREDKEIETIHLSGLAAFCVQHEVDHLDGKLFIDRLSKLKKSLVVKKQRKLYKRREAARLQVQREFEDDARLYGSSSDSNRRSKPRSVKERKKRLARKQSKKRNRSKKK